MPDKIYVTRPYLPKLHIYTTYLKKIWQCKLLTNNGPLVIELEKKLKKYLGVKYLFYVSNGTLALQIAIKALGITGDIITSPFSFAASTTVILWENCRPVFADIDRNSLCIDPKQIEKLITPATQAILAVHVYGYPCNVKQIEKIARKYKLKVIYDAAHAFGTKIGKSSILKFGDISAVSLHATKSFHTAEGGLLVTDNDKLAKKISLYRNFGYNDEDYSTLGINGKNSEFHAALGLCNLKNIDKQIRRNKKISDLYENYFRRTHLTRPFFNGNITYNYSYYPLIFSSQKELLKVKYALEKQKIYPRRYFYPSLNRLPYINSTQKCPVSESVAQRIMCLPLYSSLSIKDARRIIKTISQNI